MITKVLHRNHTVRPTNINCAKNMAHNFNISFHEKIMAILPHQQIFHLLKNYALPFWILLTHFLLVKLSNCRKGLQMPSVRLIKKCQDILICPNAKIINTSLSSGVFPLSTKAALVKSLIKRHNLDCNVLSNYRRVSNSSYLSKITE